MTDVRHTYLHYMIDPLLYARSNAIDREQPILKEVRDAPLDFRYRSDTVPLTIECLIKAIEARTMDTGIPEYKIPAGVDRSDLPTYEHQQEAVEQKVEAVRLAAVAHDMRRVTCSPSIFMSSCSVRKGSGQPERHHRRNGLQHGRRPAGASRAADRVRQAGRRGRAAAQPAAQADRPRSCGGQAPPATLPRPARWRNRCSAAQDDPLQSAADAARAHFILARASIHDRAIPTRRSTSFRKRCDQQGQRLLAWSHIYLGRMLDLECKRDEAVRNTKRRWPCATASRIRGWPQSAA